MIYRVLNTGMPYTLQTCYYIIIITIILWLRKQDVSSIPAWRCIPGAHFHCLSSNCLPGFSLAMFTSLTSFLLLHPDFSGFSGHWIEIRDRYLAHRKYPGSRSPRIFGILMCIKPSKQIVVVSQVLMSRPPRECYS